MKKNILISITSIILINFISIAQDYNWYKGNTHTHTTNSDGNEFPRRVVRWYLDNNYNFLVLSDHNTLTNIKYLDTDKNDDFILIQGEEVTDAYQKKPVHLNAINVNKLVEPQHGNSITETLQNNINAIRKVGSVPQINHPNWKWSFTDNEISQLKNVKLFELYNFNKDCNNFGAGGAPGMEEIWDKMLSNKILLYGIASDDTHDYLGEFLPAKASPGKAWIMVKAKELTPEAIVSSLENGDFYSTNGIQLKDLSITDKEYIVDIKQSGDSKYTTFFIGKDGKVLKEDFNLKAVYQFRGNEIYVRAKIISSEGDFAITQPVMLNK